MEIELGRVIRGVRRFGWVVLMAMVLFGFTLAGWGALLPKTYTSETTLVVVSTSDLVGNTSSLLALAESPSVLLPVMAELHVEGSVEDFREDVDAYRVGDTSMIRIEVTRENAQQSADIANAITESLSLRSYDLGLGILQRDLNNLVYERDQIDLQLATVNAQIDQFTSQADDLSSEEQIRLSELQDERLLLQQRRSDLEGDIRSALNSVALFDESLMVNEVAVPAEVSNETSPVILGVIGAILGGLVGAAIMLWMELRDPTVRDDQHLRDMVGAESVIYMNADAVGDVDHASVKLTTSRIVGVVRTVGANTIFLVSSRPTDLSQSFAESMRKSLLSANVNVIFSIGLLENGAGVDSVSSDVTKTAVLIVEQGKTMNQDVLNLIDVLRDIGVTTVIPVLLI